MQTILSGTIIVGFAAVLLAFIVYTMNRSRCTLEQALSSSGCPKDEIQALIQEKWLSYRRKYIFFGPYSLIAEQIPYAREGKRRLKELQAEQEVMIRQTAENIIAQTQERNRVFQEQIAARQEELERTRRIHEEILRSMRAATIPQDVLDALQILGLPNNASLDEIVQRHRLLVKQYHPDLGGDSQKFVQINTAYTRLRDWVEEHR